MPSDPQSSSSPAASPVSSGRERVLWLALLLMATVLAFVGLDETPFWEDEAHAAVFAKNILDFGYPTGFDGRNLAAYRNGLHLNETFVNVKETWAQHYLIAASFALFGVTTWAGRLPMVLCGLAALALLPWLSGRLYGRARPGLAALALLTLTPTYLLYIRQCRYYALAVLLTLLAVGLFTYLQSGKWRSIFGFSLVMTLLFYTHTLGCLATGAGLTALLLLPQHRSRLKPFCWATAFAGLLALPWIIYSRPWDVSVAEIIRFASPGYAVGRELAEGYGNSLGDRLRLLWLIWRDFNAFSLFPFLFAAPSLYWAWRNRNSDESGVRQLLVFSFVFSLALATFSPQFIQSTAFSDFRYQVPLLPMLALLSALVFMRLWQFNRLAAMGTALLFIGTNLLGLLPFYAKLSGGNEALARYISFPLPGYIEEISTPRSTMTEAAFDLLQKTVPADDTLYVYPESEALALIVYLGDRTLFSSIIAPKSSTIGQVVADKLPRWIWQPPADAQWILQYGSPVPGLTRVLESRFERVAALPVYGWDTTRPEPHLHRYREPTRFDKTSQGVYLWQNRFPTPREKGDEGAP